MELPNNEAVFSVDVEGETTFKRYDGQFTVRCVLNMGQKHAMELEKTRLLGNYSSPTEGLAGIAVIFANLRAKITDGPEWWKQSAGGSNIKDENILVELYTNLQRTETEWRQKVRDLANPPVPVENSSSAPQTT
jgi:hypothetical protein